MPTPTTIRLDESGKASISASDLAGASQGNCTLWFSPSTIEFSSEDVGIHEIHFRVESGSTVAGMEQVKLSDLVSDVHELYEAAAEEEGVELTLDISEPGVLIRGNRELLSQAISKAWRPCRSCQCSTNRTLWTASRKTRRLAILRALKATLRAARQ